MEAIVVALIAAVPSSVAAAAAWRAAKHTKTNGSQKTIGQLSELTYEELKHIRQDLEFHRTLPADIAHREDR
jgi:hypothetical protein